MENLLLRNASPSMRDKLRLEFEARKKLVAYIPFLRRGDFWVEYADPKTGERAVQAFESARERGRRLLPKTYLLILKSVNIVTCTRLAL